jgi:putative tricarboxylic transport membrane protein
MEYIIPALEQLLTPACMGLILAGVVFGMVVGALPGLGVVLAITMILPMTFAMGLVPSVTLILAVYCSSIYGGSISAVLINTPGTPNAAATCMDGYPMTLRGETNLALGWVTVASVYGGIFSIFVLVFAAPQLAAIALSFGPVETFALICLAMTCIITVSHGSMVTGISSGALGLLMASVGGDPITGDIRFDFGYFPLTGGIGFIPVLMGVFAMSEVFMQIANLDFGDRIVVKGKVGMRIPPLAEWLKRWKTLIKSPIIGSLVGALPGTGGSMAVFMSYGEAKRAGRYKDKLGTGEPEGLLAAESANNAVTGGALVPTLALGIPGDAAAAVIMSALIIQGVQPGVRLMVDNPDIIYTAFVALAIINIVMLFVGWGSARFWAKILVVPKPLLFTGVTVFALVGSYGVRGNEFDMLVTLATGILGFLMRYAGYSMIPLVIGMVLGPIFELSLRQSLVLTDGSFLKFFVGHPVAVFIFLLVALFLFVPMWVRRKNVPIEE